MGRPDDRRRETPIPTPWTTRIPDEDLRWFNFCARSAFFHRIEPPAASGDLALPRPEVQASDNFTLAGISTRDVLVSSWGWGRLEEIRIPAFDLPETTDVFAEVVSAAPEAEASAEIETLSRPDTLGLDTPNTGPPAQSGDLLTPLDCRPISGAVLAEDEMPPAQPAHREDPMLPAGLYPFQRSGASWLLESESAVLADEMGLGKTVQVIAALRALSHRSRDLHALVICPRSALSGWMRALRRWAPGLVADSIHGRQQDRRAAWKAALSRCHVLVSTYEAIRQDMEELRGRTFDVIVADHAQWIRNPATATALAVRSVGARRRWALTGMAADSRFEDMAGIFAFLRPGLMEAVDIAGLPPAEAEALVRPLMLRRRREDVLSELPERMVDTRWLALSEAQRRTYERVQREGLAHLWDSASASVQEVLAIIRHLRRICNADPRTGDSSKIECLLEYLEEAGSSGRKTIVVAQDADTLTLIARRIAHHSPLVDTGQMAPDQRARMEAAFVSKETYKVLLMSPKAGGVGLNLASVADIFYFDRWWVPAPEHPPGIGARRAGQARTVFVTRPVCEGTIEEWVEDLLAQKAALPAETANDLAEIDLEQVLSEEDLFGLFGLAPPRYGRSPAIPQAGAVTGAQEGPAPGEA